MNFKKRVLAAALSAGALVASTGAFAQASGVTTIDTTSTVNTILALVTTVSAIGAAVLSVVVVAYGFKVVKGFLGGR